MEDFSLYMLDITMNSVRAGATRIGITLEETDEWLTFTVTDNGCGMTQETLRRLSDPFFTTRTTRKVGLGIPFFRMLSEMTGGTLHIDSSSEQEHPEDHGTTLKATFGLHHLDFVPMGDLTGTVITLIQGSPDVDFTYTHVTPSGTVRLATEEIRTVLGDGISLASYEVLLWMKEYLEEGYSEIHYKNT